MKMNRTLPVVLAGLRGLTFSGAVWGENRCHDQDRSRHRACSHHRRDDLAWWRGERAARQANIDDYIAKDAEDWSAFKNTPLGNRSVPTIMIRLFPEIFPEIWGPYEAFMSPQGFGPDGIEPGSVLPLGISRLDSTTVLAAPPAVPRPVFLQSSNLTCAGCHLAACGESRTEPRWSAAHANARSEGR